MQLSLPLDNIKQSLLGQNDEVTGCATFDRGFVLLAVCLYVIGMVMVASASMPVAERLFDNPFYLFFKHCAYIGISIIIAVVALQVPMHRWQQFSGYLLVVAIVLLVAVLLIGRNVNGSTRWLVLGPITVQSAEPAKLFFFCYLSAYLVRRRDEVMENIKGFIKPLVVFISVGAASFKTTRFGHSCCYVCDYVRLTVLSRSQTLAVYLYRRCWRCFIIGTCVF